MLEQVLVGHGTLIVLGIFEKNGTFLHLELESFIFVEVVLGFELDFGGFANNHLIFK